ncbi:ER membrane protein complex subunit 7 [Hordeum vulgare]|nr:ER membrane protein complex subunit 7 [Hordeum vulgare]
MSPIRALIVLAAVLAACLGPAAAADQPGSGEGHTIAGRIKIEAARGFGLPAKTSNTKVILNGVPAGTHLIEVSSLGYFFSPVRVDISARNPGHIQAALTENRRVLNELVLEPLKEEQYYEMREPFNILSLLKSPMGMMVGFMVVMVFVMPKMMENIDPEEIKQAQEQMRNSPASFSGLLARANS